MSRIPCARLLTSAFVLGSLALAWLLKRWPNILLICGTSSVEYLRENVKAASLQLPRETVAKLNTIGTNKA